MNLDILLRASGVGMKFAGLTALDDVSFDVKRGAITSLIGPNGAGKTTLLNVISGIYRQTAGMVSYSGERLDGMHAAARARRGLRRTFQTVHLFPGLTVVENLMIGDFYQECSKSWLRALVPLGIRQNDTWKRYDAILAGFKLQDKADMVATDLAYGDQRRVEIARALVGSPTLLLLDEPAAGMNEQETAMLRDDIFRIRDQGITVLLIEHDMSLVMNVSDRIVVLDFGRKIAEGTPQEVREDPAVIRSYLGSTA